MPVTRAGPELVGREVELTRILDLLRDTGSPAALLLAGDAGVGKTRLLQEARDRVTAEGVRVFAGHCLDFGEGALPYLPFSEILGRIAETEPEAVAAVVADHPALARLLPGRRLHTGEQRHDGGRDVDRGELFAAVHHLLAHLAEQGPVLVIVEDLHWADRSTRELLTYLFTLPVEGPLALVGSYRLDDLHRRHPLRGQVAEWSRLREVERLVVEPLTEPEVRLLVGRLHPDPVPGGAVDDIVARAEGNAFFVEELVGAAGGPEPGWVPPDLADVLLVRLDRLDDVAREVVRAASAAGRRVAHDALAVVTGLPSSQLDAALRSAVEHNVLDAAGADYSFRHALLAEAVHDDLLPGERVRVHARYVEAIRAGDIRASAAELARHARAALDLDAALLAAVEAGDDAMNVGGPDDAADHYEAALALLAESGRVEVDRARLAVRAADALALSGRTSRAAQVLGEQLERLPADTVPGDRARVLAALAKVLLITEGRHSPLELSESAVALVPDAPTPLRAEVLATRAQVLSAYGRYAEADDVGMAAFDLAQKLALPHLGSDVRTTLLWLKRATSKEAVREALVEAIADAHASGALEPELRARYLLARNYQDHADFVEATRWFDSARDLGETSGRPWQPYALESRWHLAWLALIGGDVARVHALTDVGAVAGPGAPPLMAALFETLRLQQDAWQGAPVDPGALARLRTMWREEGLIAVHSAAIEIDLASGDAERALAAHDAAVGVLSEIWYRWFSGRVRLSALTLAALNAAVPSTPSDRVDAVVVAGDRLLADGAEALRRYADPSGHWGPEGQAWAKRMDAEAARLAWLTDRGAPPADDLVRLWREAETLFVDLGHVYETARVRVALAGILRAVGDAAGAREVGDLAREAAHRMGARPLLDELVRQGSSPAPPSDTPTEQQLTPRELEILTLVARGGSNGQIGRQLFISTKTVSVHVSRILAKLGVASRTEAAAVGRRRGLLPDE